MQVRLASGDTVYGLVMVDINGVPITFTQSSNSNQVQNASPLAGATVQMTDDDKDGTLVLQPASLLLNLNVVLPTDANSRIGQIRRIVSTQAITTLNLTGAATILNLLSGLAVNAVVSYQKIASNKWIRI